MLSVITKAIENAVNESKKDEQRKLQIHEEIERRRIEELRLQEEKAEQFKRDTELQQIRTGAERFARALDYAVTLKYYFRGYGDSRYPKYVRTYEFGIIPREEYDQRKKKDPKSVRLVTYCNVLARKIGRGCFDYGLYDSRRDPEYNWLNWDLRGGYNLKYSKIFYNLTPRDSKRILIASAKEGRIRELTCAEAQTRANRGIYVLAVGGGHEAVVYPDLDNKYSDSRGCKIAQAGWYNVSNIYISEFQSWGKNWKKQDIRFFEFQYECQGFLDYLKLENAV